MIKTRSYDILINHCLCVACYVYTLIVVGGGAGRRSARIMTMFKGAQSRFRIRSVLF